MAEVPRLVVVVDRPTAGSDAAFLQALKRLKKRVPSDGSVWIQLRAKGFEGALVAAAAVVRGWRAPVLVNGDEALARELGLDGVHWPQRTIPPARSAFRWRCASVHDESAARRAVVAGAQCVLFSPVYAPRCKEGEGVGLAALQRMVQRCGVPVLALGGVTPARVHECLLVGAAGVAVLSPALSPGFDPLDYVISSRKVS